MKASTKTQIRDNIRSIREIPERAETLEDYERAEIIDYVKAEQRKHFIEVKDIIQLNPNYSYPNNVKSYESKFDFWYNKLIYGNFYSSPIIIEIVNKYNNNSNQSNHSEIKQEKQLTILKKYELKDLKDLLTWDNYSTKQQVFIVRILEHFKLFNHSEFTYNTDIIKLLGKNPSNTDYNKHFKEFQNLDAIINYTPHQKKHRKTDLLKIKPLFQAIGKPEIVNKLDTIIQSINID